MNRSRRDFAYPCFVVVDCNYEINWVPNCGLRWNGVTRGAAGLSANRSMSLGTCSKVARFNHRWNRFDSRGWPKLSLNSGRPGETVDVTQPQLTWHLSVYLMLWCFQSTTTQSMAIVMVIPISRSYSLCGRLRNRRVHRPRGVWLVSFCCVWLIMRHIVKIEIWAEKHG